MAEANISIPELAKALRRIKTLDELRCMGCGYEHDCSIHGCVIIRQVADVIEALYGEVRADAECGLCAHGYDHDCPDDVFGCVECCASNLRPDCCCKDCVDGSKWVWIGPEKEDGNETTDNR